MKLQEFKEYVSVEKVNMIIDHGVFVGTQNYVFCFPSKTVEHYGREITTTEFSLKGKEIKDAITDVLSRASDVEELETVLLELTKEFDDVPHFNLNEVEGFQVKAGFFGSGINIQKKGKRGYSPFIQKLGQSKKEIKAFYDNHPKIK